MSQLYSHSDYQSSIQNFNASRYNSDCDWSCFESVHRKISMHRCPICECELDGTLTRLSNRGVTSIIATIDHYRPQHHYSFLRCEHTNYLLMCSECNNIYKKSDFPLHGSIQRGTCSVSIEDEKPLIANPIQDDLLALFILVFKRSSNGKNVLELAPKESTGYLYEKAVETIKLFGLGDCVINRHPNENVFNCRIGLLEAHFGVFHGLAKAMKSKDNQKIGLELQNNKDILQKYGFFTFLMRKQFIDLIP